MPGSLTQYLPGFYSQMRHWFEADGAVAEEGVNPLRGALQGCPISCLLMASIMSVWVVALREIPEVQAHVFVDDRIVSTTSETPEECLVEASLLSGELDEVLGLERHPDKRAAASNTEKGRKRLKRKAAILGPAKDSFLVLGIRYAFGRRRQLCFRHDKLARAKYRLRRIRIAGRKAAARRKLVRSVVLPILTWQGAWAPPATGKLERLRREVERTIHAKVPEARSRFLTWTCERTLGARADPIFEYDLAALRDEAWRVRRRTQGGQVDHLAEPTPRMLEAAAEWGWQRAGAGVWDTPDGEIRIGWDGWKSIVATATLGWQRQLWKTEPRVTKRPLLGTQDARAVFRRNPRRLPLLDEHKHWLKATEQRPGAPARLTALAAGLEGQALATVRARQEGTYCTTAPPPPLACSCGRDPEGSRRHLAWRCRLSLPERGHWVPPGRSAAEGLLVRLAPLPPLPALMPSPEEAAVPAGLADAIRGTQGRALLASDGGSFDRRVEFRRGSVGFAVQGPDGLIRGFGGRRPGLDQTSYGAEVWGLWVLLLALQAAPTPADIFIDNLAVVRTGRRVLGGGAPPKNMPEAWEAIARVGRDLPDVRLHWVPSHGKRPDWSPAAGFSGEVIRRLNAVADQQASDVQEALMREAAPTHAARKRIRNWTRAALVRQHAGLLRQRELAGLDNADCEAPAPANPGPRPGVSTQQQPNRNPQEGGNEEGQHQQQHPPPLQGLTQQA